MACDVNALLADGACYTCLDEKQAEILEITLLASIVTALDPGADVSPATLAAAAAAYDGLDEKQIDLIEIGLLCSIAQAI